MSNKFETDFEKVLYAGLIDYAAKTLNSDEIAPLFKAKSSQERKAIKRSILKNLSIAVKRAGKKLSEKSLIDPTEMAQHQEEVRKIIDSIFRGNE
jgi:hypothetical protein